MPAPGERRRGNQKQPAPAPTPPDRYPTRCHSAARSDASARNPHAREHWAVCGAGVGSRSLAAVLRHPPSLPAAGPALAWSSTSYQVGSVDHLSPSCAARRRVASATLSVLHAMSANRCACGCLHAQQVISAILRRAEHDAIARLPAGRRRGPAARSATSDCRSSARRRPHAHAPASPATACSRQRPKPCTSGGIGGEPSASRAPCRPRDGHRTAPPARPAHRRHSRGSARAAPPARCSR